MAPDDSAATYSLLIHLFFGAESGRAIDRASGSGWPGCPPAHLDTHPFAVIVVGPAEQNSTERVRFLSLPSNGFIHFAQNAVEWAFA